MSKLASERDAALSQVGYAARASMKVTPTAVGFNQV